MKHNTLKRLVGMSSISGPVRHPFQVMAAIQVTFGGLPEFSKAVAPKVDKPEMAIQLEQPHQKPFKARRLGDRALKGDAYIAKFQSYSLREQKRITRETREWLLELIAKNPRLNRWKAGTTKGNKRRKYHLRHLSLVDRKWFDQTLPAIPPGSVKRLPTEQAISMAVAHIKARYDEAIATRPLERISKTALITHLACETAPNLLLRSQEVLEAIAKYADDTPKRRQRITHWICLEVQMRQPNHTYADFEKYVAKNDHDFKNRFQRARKWLDKFDKA